MNTTPIQQSYKNKVLASLPTPEVDRLAAHLSPVRLILNQTLHDSGQIVDTVYFLEEGICSIVVTMETGNTVEVGITGRDGFVGVPAVLGTGHSPNRSFIQIPGHGFGVKARIRGNNLKRPPHYACAYKEASRDCLCRPHKPPPVIAFMNLKSVWLDG